MNSVVTQQEREQLYREMGWWQDERLESRYERLSAVRLNKLAVTDNHGSTKALLEALYHDQYDPVYWRAVRRDILASPERRDAIARAKKKKHDA